MYHKIQDFLQDWKAESAITQKIFNNLSDDSLSQKVYADGRTLGFIAWHITISIGEISSKMGIKVDCPEENSEPPASAKEIMSAYKNASDSLYEFLEKNWKDEKLSEESNMYGQMWKNGLSFNVLVTHQIHHRAQMTVLMRQAGLKVPGSYGPAKEEWAAMGMTAPK